MVVFSAGLDLSGKQENPSGLVVLGFDNSRIDLLFLGSLFKDSEILEKILEYRVNIVAIDAPLTKQSSSQHFRRVDLKIKKMEFNVLPLTWRGMNILVERAISIAEKLRSSGVLVIETHPLSSLKSSSCRSVYELAGKHGLNLPSSISKHEGDAFIAGLTSIYYYLGRAVVVRDVDGEIVLLPRIC